MSVIRTLSLFLFLLMATARPSRALVGQQLPVDNPHRGTTQSDKDLLVISDIDDTIRLSQIAGHKAGQKPKKIRINTVVNYTSVTIPFEGMPEVYGYLANSGAKFAYVSAIPSKLDSLELPGRFLRGSQFPEGPLYSRSGGDRSTHKEQAIRKLIHQNPGKRIVLLGDNGELDSQVFAKLQADPETGHAIQSVHIHEIYDQHGKPPIPESQHSFLTAGDLAVGLYQQGLMTEEEAKTRLESAIQNLRPADESESEIEARVRRHKVFPDFADISRKRIQDLLQKSAVRLPPQSGLAQELALLENALVSQREKTGGLSCFRNFIYRVVHESQNAYGR